MKKTLILLVAMWFVLSCENNESKELLDEASLRETLSDRSDYNEIVDILTSNYAAISSMNEEERSKFFELSAKGKQLDFSALEQYGKMCEKFGFSAKHIKMIDNLKAELRANYLFRTSDFDKIMKADYGAKIEILLSSSRILVAAPYPYCIMKCSSEADVRRGEVEASISQVPGYQNTSAEFKEAILDLVYSTYYSGCYDCCSQATYSCRPEAQE
ncbi:MAG: hypothetical protein JNJ75_05820 [Cyclobacteriaceae bacterium]|nr:hypothetical protein [Cyclobacteriaceae bacterium]